MVPQTLAECHDLGYDVPTWIEEELVDMVCPCDRTYADFNARYDEFSELTRSSDCRLYPTMIPLMCKHDSASLLKPENYRALAQNFYGAGADGVTIFNYQYHWARQTGTARYPGPVEAYPLALTYLRDLRDPSTIRSRPRHYRFHPLHAGPAPTGAVKNDRTVLRREAGSEGEYRFRVCEPGDEDTDVTVTFSAQGLLPRDEIVVQLNGVEVSELRRVFHPDGRLEKFGRPLPAFSSVWFQPQPGMLNGWDNQLAVRLTSLAPEGVGEIVIDEVAAARKEAKAI